jgi:hypothetical protein
MNPYEVGEPELRNEASEHEQSEVDEPYEPRLLRLFLTIAARTTVYGILALLLLVAILYWLQ